MTAIRFEGSNSDLHRPSGAELGTLAAAVFKPMTAQNRRFRPDRLCRIAALALLFLACLPLVARDRSGVDYGAGLIVNIPLPESEVTAVVREAAQNGIIRGTKEYNKDEYIKGAEEAASTSAFPAWTDGGKVFYKVRKQALDPRNFKDGGDVGALAVRYVVQPEGVTNTVLRIDAIFVEEFRHTAHLSNGSVEGSEYKNIQDHLDALELMKKQAAEAEAERRAQLAKKKFESDENSSESGPADTLASGANAARISAASMPTSPSVADLAKADAPPAVGPRPGESLQDYAADLRRQVERRVKYPGAPLKSAPFRSASTMEHLPSGSDVLVVISTTYWLGVETHDGQHGWVAREQLEELP
jgi:hypothetical protein